jgi:hypothetical protein
MRIIFLLHVAYFDTTFEKSSDFAHSFFDSGTSSAKVLSSKNSTPLALFHDSGTSSAKLSSSKKSQPSSNQHLSLPSTSSRPRSHSTPLLHSLLKWQSLHPNAAAQTVSKCGMRPIEMRALLFLLENAMNLLLLEIEIAEMIADMIGEMIERGIVDIEVAVPKVREQEEIGIEVEEVIDGMTEVAAGWTAEMIGEVCIRLRSFATDQILTITKTVAEIRRM